MPHQHRDDNEDEVEDELYSFKYVHIEKKCPTIAGQVASRGYYADFRPPPIYRLKS
jgi:hypothetical protein